MKKLLELFVGILFTPWLAVAAIIAVIKTIFVITFAFTWEQADKMHDKIMEKIVKFMKWLKGGEK
jgi:hypothetical protein